MPFSPEFVTRTAENCIYVGMGRTKAILQSEFPYHVSARCINKEWFNIPMKTVWEIMSTELMFLTFAYDVKIHSFVLMQNHFHLLVSTPSANISVAMWHFMGRTSKQLTRSGNRINQTYGGRYFRSVIQGDRYFRYAYKYVYRNPVKAGLADRPENYEFSTLYGLLGNDRLVIPTVEDTLLFESMDETLSWLNSKPADNDWDMVRKAMRKRNFAFAKDRNGNVVELSLDSL